MAGMFVFYRIQCSIEEPELALKPSTLGTTNSPAMATLVSISASLHFSQAILAPIEILFLMQQTLQE